MLNTTFFEDKAVYQPAIAGILLYMVAPLGMTMLPLLVGTVTEHLGFSDNQAGYLASIDLLGIVVAASFLRENLFNQNGALTAATTIPNKSIEAK